MHIQLLIIYILLVIFIASPSRVMHMVSWVFIGFVASILFTPGPTNTLLASSGISVGFRKSTLLIPAEAFGYLIAITCWGVLIDRISIFAPFLPPLLKLFSAIYILVLAFKLWRLSFENHLVIVPSIRKRELFLATLLNPKAILFATVVFPDVIWINPNLYVSHMLTFLLILIPVGFFWILIGQFLSSGKITWLNQSNLQRTATIILILFAFPISYSAVQGFIKL